MKKADQNWYLAALILGVIALVLIVITVIVLLGSDGSITNAFNSIFRVGKSYTP